MVSYRVNDLSEFLPGSIKLLWSLRTKYLPDYGPHIKLNNYPPQADMFKWEEQSTVVNVRHKRRLLPFCSFMVFCFFYYLEAACIWFMHIRHRCRNSPGLIKGFSALPAVIPTGLSAAMLHELLPGARIWNVPTDKWTPHLSWSPPSFFPPFAHNSYSFIRGCVGWKLANAMQREVMTTSLK